MVKFIFTLLVPLLLLVPAISDAALLYLDPPRINFGPGNTFSVKVRIDNEGECINAADLVIDFPADVVKAVDASRGESIFNLWIEEPSIDNDLGRVKMAGGIPGGYCGRIEGDPGLTNSLAEIIFQTSDKEGSHSKRGVFDIVFNSESQVLLNDGLGTKANLALANAELLVGEPGPDGQNNWLDSLKRDAFPPDAFTVELYKDPGIIGGKYFIVFSTADKQSGLDHFEIEESDLNKEGFIRGTNKPAVWVAAKSPYVLQDQTLNSLIKVKAIDKAGNSRMVVYIPDESMRQKSMSSALKLLFYSIFFAIPVLSPFIIRSYIRKKKYKKHLPVNPESDKVEPESENNG